MYDDLLEFTEKHFSSDQDKIARDGLLKHQTSVEGKAVVLAEMIYNLALLREIETTTAATTTL